MARAIPSLIRAANSSTAQKPAPAATAPMTAPSIEAVWPAPSTPRDSTETRRRPATAAGFPTAVLDGHVRVCVPVVAVQPLGVCSMLTLIGPAGVRSRVPLQVNGETLPSASMDAPNGTAPASMTKPVDGAAPWFKLSVRLPLSGSVASMDSRVPSALRTNPSYAARDHDRHGGGPEATTA